MILAFADKGRLLENRARWTWQRKEWGLMEISYIIAAALILIFFAWMPRAAQRSLFVALLIIVISFLIDEWTLQPYLGSLVTLSMMTAFLLRALGNLRQGKWLLFALLNLTISLGLLQLLPLQDNSFVLVVAIAAMLGELLWYLPNCSRFMVLFWPLILLSTGIILLRISNGSTLFSIEYFMVIFAGCLVLYFLAEERRRHYRRQDGKRLDVGETIAYAGAAVFMIVSLLTNSFSVIAALFGALIYSYAKGKMKTLTWLKFVSVCVFLSYFLVMGHLQYNARLAEAVYEMEAPQTLQAQQSQVYFAQDEGLYYFIRPGGGAAEIENLPLVYAYNPKKHELSYFRRSPAEKIEVDTYGLRDVVLAKWAK